MSMFHELMMRPKSQAEQIMYATIKGSLTNNNNVITFDNNIANYLQVQQAIAPTTPFEIKIKFNYTYNSYAALFHSHMENDKYGIGLNVENNKLNYFVSTVNSGAWAFDMYSDNSLSQDTDYYVKFGWSGTEYYADLSTDDVTYNRVISFSSNEEPRHDIAITQMGNYYDNMSLQGSIDLLNSYIKLGSTKYNLQAVVGYTKVGNPTIVDGVVSGFSTSDYLQIAYNQNSGNITEFVIKIEDKNVTGTAIFFTTTSATNIRIIMNGTSIWYNFNNNSSTFFSMPNGNDYFVKYTYKNNIASLYLSEDGINYSLLGSSEVSDYGSSLSINLGANNNMGDTKINLKETYIKINNKLWFNGQQA